VWIGIVERIFLIFYITIVRLSPLLILLFLAINAFAQQASVAGGISGGYLTDSRDGKKYKVIKIGEQTWMAENLSYNAISSKCYDDQEKYGRLYDWSTAKSACPIGWHLPSNEEWNVLVASTGGEKIAGKFLKATSGWKKNGNGEDKYGFTALPGGYGSSVGYINYVGSYGSWWSATEYDDSKVYSWFMYYYYDDVGCYNFSKSFLRSVRCVQG